MASAIISQLKTLGDDEKRKLQLHSLGEILFTAPGQPSDPNFLQGDFLQFCSLQTDESPVTSVWLLRHLSDLCRKDDVCAYHCVHIPVGEFASPCGIS